MCGLVRAGSQFRELFQEIVSRGGLDIEELEAIILNCVQHFATSIASGYHRSKNSHQNKLNYTLASQVPQLEL